jgi:subtilisin family serine protease
VVHGHAQCDVIHAWRCRDQRFVGHRCGLSAWAITKGSSGTVIADVDTGIRFDHPDLLRAGFGGRLLPGYDFVDQDYNPTTGAALGTFLIANDGDGWDPDPSDPGDWINSTDQMNTTLFPPSKIARFRIVLGMERESWVCWVR